MRILLVEEHAKMLRGLSRLLDQFGMNIRTLFVCGALLLFASGAAIGLVAAVLTGRALASLLFNVTGFDRLSFSLATLVLLVVAVAACSLPARRAASVDPSLALRAE